MEDLRLIGLSADGSRLVLQNAAGDSLALPLDERVHAAMRGDRSRLGQLQIAVDGQLRPREIQARIRAGQSTEQVAEAAGLPIDRVSRYEAPILLERSHMAETAQAVSVRRVTDSVNTPLGVLVQARLDEHNVAPESLVWDSYRRDDGRWQVTLAYEAGGRARTAAWIFDPLRRTLEPADDEARWLTDEERAAPPAGPAAHSVRTRGPRLASVPAPEPEVEAEAEESRHDTMPVVAAVPAPEAEVEVDAVVDEQTGAGEPAVRGHEPKPAAKSSRSGGRRASVPSWDEILFGSAPKRDGD
jgi:Protein of unknown function (DUF3071)